MKKYMISTCIVLAVLSLTVCMVAQGQPAGGGGAGMATASQRPNKAARLVSLTELEKQIANLRAAIQKAQATDPCITTLQGDALTSFTTQYTEESTAINQIVTTLNSLRPIAGGGRGGRGGLTGGLTTAVTTELLALAKEEKATMLTSRLEALAKEAQTAAASRGGMGGGMRAGSTAAPVPETGFVQLFNGTNLDGWEGDTSRWRVENGTIVAQFTAENPLRQNTFLIWRGGKPANFELKLEYRLTGGNSGIQYRSTEEANSNFVMSGYQADIDAAQLYTGNIFEENGRGFLAPRGQFNYIAAVPEGQRITIGNLASLGTSDELKALIKTDNWNEIHIIARGNTLVHIYNGRMTGMLIDDDTSGRAMEGLIGLQLHYGDPMKIEFRNIRLKQL